MKKIKQWIPVMIIVVVILGLYGWSEYNRKQKDTADLELVAEKKAADIISEFESDEKKANSLYNDKALVVKGVVQSIELTDTTQRIILAGKEGAAGIICEFAPDQRKNIETLSPGRSINVKGVCTGFLMDVILVRCLINQ